MAWTVEPAAREAALARGLERQWALVAKEALPPVLGLVAAVPAWLAAMIRARCLAGSDARANALLDGFDHEIARVTGHAAPRWPARLRRMPRMPSGGIPALPLLDPSQHLVCTGALARESTATIAALSALLVGAWAEPPPVGLAPDLRVRAAAVGLPEPSRGRWLRGTGLTPPDDVVPGEHRGALAVLRQAFGDPTREPSTPAREVSLSHDAFLRPSAALDVVLATATVRTCLRAAGELPDVVPAELAPVVPLAVAVSVPERPRLRAA
ncbi:MAG TPA: hypothetical protein VFG69_09700 [Nannocystaceae bacterium]|nr:hypothetical protein [Nannocystaceae bacterium]